MHKSYSKFNFIILIVMVFSGCGGIRLSEDTVPSPVVSTLPVSMAIHYHESLQNAKTQITSPQYGGILIRADQAQFAGFDRAFAQLFENTTTVNDEYLVPEGYDGLIKIRLDSFEIMGSQITNNPFLYRAEISYEVNVVNKANQLIHSWYVTGEGEAFDENTNPGPLVREASRVALRDALSEITFNLLEHVKLN